MNDQRADLTPLLSARGWSCAAAELDADGHADQARVARLASRIADLMQQPVGLATRRETNNGRKEAFETTGAATTGDRTRS